MSDRQCAWCRGPIPTAARRDAITCSKRCRQARNRFTRGVGPAPDASRVDPRPLRLAYADPPYIGMSRRYYENHPDYAGEVDHADLIRRLSIDYDGWALSLSAASLQPVLALCPPGVRVAAWHRGERPTRSSAPLNAWEPVIYFGGRLDPDLKTPQPLGESSPDRRTGLQPSAPADEPPEGPRLDGAGIREEMGPDVSLSPAGATRRVTPASDDASNLVDETRLADPHDASRRAASTGRDAIDDASREYSRRIDSLVYVSRPRLTDPDRVVGAKPAAFCRWMFDLLGALPVDDFTDLYPGSGGVMRAWRIYAGLPEHP